MTKWKIRYHYHFFNTVFDTIQRIKKGSEADTTTTTNELFELFNELVDSWEAYYKPTYKKSYSEFRTGYQTAIDDLRTSLNLGEYKEK